MSPIRPIAEHEARFIAAAQRGDHAAFEALHALHRAAVVTRLSYLVGPGGSVDDLVQETFLRAYRALPRFGGRCPFRFWLLRIAARVAHSERRGLRRSIWRLFAGDDEQRALSPSVAAQSELHIELRALYQALDGLSPRLREAVILFDLEGRTLAEISGELGVPLHTIAARVRRGRALLRKQLGAENLVERTLVPCPGDAA